MLRWVEENREVANFNQHERQAAMVALQFSNYAVVNELRKLKYASVPLKTKTTAQPATNPTSDRASENGIHRYMFSFWIFWDNWGIDIVELYLDQLNLKVK